MWCLNCLDIILRNSYSLSHQKFAEPFSVPGIEGTGGNIGEKETSFLKTASLAQAHLTVQLTV